MHWRINKTGFFKTSTCEFYNIMFIKISCLKNGTTIVMVVIYNNKFQSLCYGYCNKFYLIKFSIDGIITYRLLICTLNYQFHSDIRVTEKTLKTKMSTKIICSILIFFFCTIEYSEAKS